MAEVDPNFDRAWAARKELTTGSKTKGGLDAQHKPDAKKMVDKYPDAKTLNGNAETAAEAGKWDDAEQSWKHGRQDAGGTL